MATVRWAQSLTGAAHAQCQPHQAEGSRLCQAAWQPVACHSWEGVLQLGTDQHPPCFITALVCWVCTPRDPLSAHRRRHERAPWHMSVHRGTWVCAVAHGCAPWHTSSPTPDAGSRHWLLPALQVQRMDHAEALLHYVPSTREMLKITGIGVPGRSWGPIVALAVWEPLRPAGEAWGNAAISAPVFRGRALSRAGRGWHCRPGAPARVRAQVSPKLTPWLCAGTPSEAFGVLQAERLRPAGSGPRDAFSGGLGLSGWQGAWLGGFSERLSSLVAQLYELDGDPRRKEFLDDLFSFMQKRGELPPHAHPAPSPRPPGARGSFPRPSLQP